MNRSFSKSFFFAFLSVTFITSFCGCSQDKSVIADKDELSSYLDEHPELVEDSKKLEEQWEDGYVEPDGESDE